MDDYQMLKTLNIKYDISVNALQILRKGGCVAYRVCGDSGKYFMKIIPSTFMDTAKESLNILIFLEEMAFPSPRIIFTVDGLPYIEINEVDSKYICVLFHFIEGTEPKEGEQLETVGELVGQLHNAMLNYKGKLSVQGKEFFVDRFITILNKKNYDKGKTRMFREYGEILWQRVENLPRGFCHGDMHSGNLLKTSSGKLHLLDFDTSCIAFPTYDIMIMCNSTNYFEFDEKGYSNASRTYESFLKGYSKYRTLSSNEYKAFYDLIAIYHYQLQATIIGIYGLNCVDFKFLDTQLDWLRRWERKITNERN